MQVPQRIEDVVVVVHNNDAELLCLQLQTFDTFLESCNIHIIINEYDLNPCYQRIKPQVVISNNKCKHSIRIWSREEILGCHPAVPGWSSQQLLKLLIPLEKDWVVFDSKDLLIRPVRLEELDKKQFKDYDDLSLKDPQGLFWQGILELGKSQGFPEVDPKKINMNQTPRVIDNRVIRKINSIFKNKQDFINWFCSFKVQGEFILHDYIAQVMQIDNKMKFGQGFIMGIWNDRIFKDFTLDNIGPRSSIYKCHSRVYNVDENKKIVNSWMQEIIRHYSRYESALLNGNRT